MTPDQYTSIGFLILKILVVIALFLYAMYAWIIVRQEQLMSKVMAETSEGIIRLLALIHLVSSIGLIILALILL